MQTWELILSAQRILLTSQAKALTPEELETLDMSICSHIRVLDRPFSGREPYHDAEGLAAHNWWAVARIVVHR